MKYIPLLLVLGVLSCGVGCTDRVQMSKFEYDVSIDRTVTVASAFYETPHQLRKMFTKDEVISEKSPSEGHLSGRLFLLFGDASGSFKGSSEKKYVVTYVRFAWEIMDNTYTISTLPIDKIRIKLVENYEKPTVSFFLDRFLINKDIKTLNEKFRVRSLIEENVENGPLRIIRNYFNTHEAFDKYLGYVVFTVKSEDWPTNVNLPINSDFSMK